MISGLIVLLFAGVLQGIFVLPLSYTKNWNWEHNWLMFSFWGMIFLNWIIALLIFPQALNIYRTVPSGELLLIFSFGLCWGIGAILFGLGMEKLGMGMGYPVIMGLIAGTGTLIPLLVSKPESIFTLKGIAVLLGCGLVILGILISAKAAATKHAEVAGEENKPAVFSGILIAVFAGLLSALPNIGMTFATHTMHQAIRAGIDPGQAGNLVWLLFFSVGFIANAGYTIYRMRSTGSFPALKKSFSFRNFIFPFLGACSWIGSFYLYGYSANHIGSFGPIIGWPVFMAVAILTGNLAGIWKGEWKNASSGSIRLLRTGLAIFLLAVLVIGLSNWLS